MNDLDQLIKKSLDTKETPPQQLNAVLKAQIRDRKHRQIPLWYLPMTMNFLFFLTLSLMAHFLIMNPFIPYLIHAVSLISILTSGCLTWFAVKHLDLKSKLTIEF